MKEKILTMSGVDLHCIAGLLKQSVDVVQEAMDDEDIEVKMKAVKLFNDVVERYFIPKQASSPLVTINNPEPYQPRWSSAKRVDMIDIDDDD